MPPAFAQILCLAAIGLAGCTTFPELDAAVSEEAKAAEDPELLDRRRFLVPYESQTIGTETQATLEAEAAGLRTRASGLSGAVIDSATRSELEARHLRLREEAARVAPDT